MCDIYDLKEDKVSCEYLAYLNQKKYVINQSPTIEILEGFENDSLKPLSLKSKEKSSGPKIYNSTTLHQHPSFKESNYEDEEDEDDNSDECEVESTKSNIDEDEAEKESLLSEAREELERKLSSLVKQRMAGFDYMRRVGTGERHWLSAVSLGDQEAGLAKAVEEDVEPAPSSLRSRRT